MNHHEKRTTPQKKAVIIGASGYTGAELIRLLQYHPFVSISALIAQKNTHIAIKELYPHFEHCSLPLITSIKEIEWNNVDIVFCCLPHTASQQIIASIPPSIKIIDLSADFRLRNIDNYEKWYQTKHLAPEIQNKAVYGLSEIFATEIHNATIVACPGCYPTAALLPLIPLLKTDAIIKENIIIDAKSGISGAGRSEKISYQFCETNENVRPYNVCQHRHIAEIEEVLTHICQENITVNFTPHLIPMSRGILCTIYVDMKKGININKLETIMHEAYQEHFFVTVLTHPALPSTREVYSSNHCHIAITAGRTEQKAVITSAIDNLTKGSSGQAIQNMNILFNWPEYTGLQTIPVFP